MDLDDVDHDFEFGPRSHAAAAEVFFGGDGGPKHAAVPAGVPTVAACDAMHATGWAPPNDPRRRVVTTRSHPGAAPLAGTFTESDTHADIPVAAAWHEVAVAVRQCTFAAAGEAVPAARLAA